MSTLLMSEIIVMSVFDSVLPIVISLNLETEKLNVPKLNSIFASIPNFNL